MARNISMAAERARGKKLILSVPMPCSPRKSAAQSSVHGRVPPRLVENSRQHRDRSLGIDMQVAVACKPLASTFRPRSRGDFHPHALHQFGHKRRGAATSSLILCA
jgi:hypothetical protein